MHACRTRDVAVCPGRLLAVTVGMAVALSLSAPAAHGAQEPPLSEPVEALDEALDCPESFEATGREPVLLVHGTGAVGRENFGWNLVPQLRADGFDVCTVDLPTRALADIQVAAEYVVHAVRVIHGATGRRVDVAGHSQGGLEPRWALAWWPSTRDLIDDVVTFAAPHDGTVAADAACAGGPCWPAVHQMRPGSDFLTALWRQEDLSAVHVTSMGSHHDELVQPPSTIELPGASNILLQDVCPGRPVTHVSIVADAVAYELALGAFLGDGPADPGDLPADACLRTWIDETSPHHLLDPDGTDGYRDGSFLDPEIPGSLLTSEEPELADYAADHEDGGASASGPEDGEEGAAAGTSVSRDDAAAVEVGGLDEPVLAAPAGAGDGALPATGGGAAALGAALMAVAGAGLARRRR
jgi:triacylglycerol lipase